MKSGGWTLKKNWSWLLPALGIGCIGIVLRLDASEPISGGIRAALALALVLGVALVGMQGYKKWSFRVGGMRDSMSVPIKVLGARALGNGKSLVIVDIEGDRFLLGTSRDGVVLLSALGGKPRRGRAGPPAGGGS